MKNEPQKIRKFEVKYWEFPLGKADHKKKVQLCSTELTIILKGKIDGEVDGEKIKLEAGEYILISPKVESGFPDNVFEYVVGLTIKIPSIPNDKITGDGLIKAKEIFSKSKSRKINQ